MAKYQVPQFLEVEDKIFGPLTLKQFLYSAGGAGFFFIAWVGLPQPFSTIVALPLLLFFLALAFYKVNNRPFVVTVENYFKYISGTKLYIWKKREKEIKKKAVEVKSSTLVVPELSGSKLRNMSWELDIHDSLEAPDSGVPKQ